MTIYRFRSDPSYRIEVLKLGERAVAYCAQGGGFRMQAQRADFDRLFEPETEPPPFVRCTVTAEWMDASLPCYSNGDRWNGWGMPYLTREAVDELIKIEMPVRWFDDDVIVKDDDVEGGYYGVSPVVMPDGVQAWPVGAGSWCWDACEPLKEDK